MGPPPCQGGSEPKASGGLGFFCQRMLNALTHGFEALHDIFVRETKHSDAVQL